jgi:hypothetical protein
VAELLPRHLVEGQQGREHGERSVDVVDGRLVPFGPPTPGLQRPKRVPPGLADVFAHMLLATMNETMAAGAPSGRSPSTVTPMARPRPEPVAYVTKFSGKYTHRTITGATGRYRCPVSPGASTARSAGSAGGEGGDDVTWRDSRGTGGPGRNVSPFEDPQSLAASRGSGDATLASIGPSFTAPGVEERETGTWSDHQERGNADDRTVRILPRSPSGRPPRRQDDRARLARRALHRLRGGVGRRLLAGRASDPSSSPRRPFTATPTKTNTAL